MLVALHCERREAVKSSFRPTVMAKCYLFVSEMVLDGMDIKYGDQVF